MLKQHYLVFPQQNHRFKITFMIGWLVMGENGTPAVDRAHLPRLVQDLWLPARHPHVRTCFSLWRHFTQRHQHLLLSCKVAAHCCLYVCDGNGAKETKWRLWGRRWEGNEEIEAEQGTKQVRSRVLPIHLAFFISFILISFCLAFSLSFFLYFFFYSFFRSVFIYLDLFIFSLFTCLL